MRFFILLLFGLTFCKVIYANGPADSLRDAKIDFYINESQRNSFPGGNYDLALLYADSMYLLAKEGKDDKLIFSLEALRWRVYGDVYRRQGNAEQAYKAYRSSIEVANRTVFENEKHHLSRCYIGLGYLFEKEEQLDSIYQYTQVVFALPSDHSTYFFAKRAFVALLAREEKFADALHYGDKLAKDTRQIGDQYLEHTRLATIASIHNNMGNYNEVLVYNDSCLQIARALKDSFLLIHSYNALGVGQVYQEKFQAALEWFKKSQQMAEVLFARSPYYKMQRSADQAPSYQPIPMGNLYRDVGATYIKLNEADSAEKYLDKALAISYQYKEYYNVVPALAFWAEAALVKEKDYDQALDSLKKAYALSAQGTLTAYNRNLILQRMGQIYAAMGQVDSAFLYYKRTIDFSKKEENLKLLVDVYQLLQALYYQEGDYANAYDYQKKYQEAQKKLKDETYEKKLAALEVKHELGTLRNNNEVLAENNRLQKEQLAFSAQLNQRNQFLIAALVVGFVLFLILGIVLYRQRALNEEVNKMRLEQKALKAQINPHFFFNVLNSLQGTILSKTPLEAYEQHSKFTKLMRLVLTQSEEETLPLKDELKALQLYLELEQLRAGGAFEFNIDVDLDPNQTVLVPSMLLQPFVENAIWHGVMNRGADEEKRIDIRIRSHEDYISCEIIDTGVGRKVAAQIKAQKTQQHKSMGIQVTQDRLELFRLRHKLPLRFKFEDQYNAANQLSGTKVSLEIPVLTPAL